MLSIILFVLLLIGLCASAPHKITSVPLYTGAPIKFNQYSGYYQVNKESDRELFYWFVESQRDPSSDPVILWMNGGPGCSSLEGLIQEQGPFHLNDAGTEVAANPHSWNRIASVIFVESPAGVGYSYSMNAKEYETCNDNRTADDMWHFLQAFFDDFPQLAKNDFYVAAESYGGHYSPVVTKRIHDGNQASPRHVISLKGYMVGNGITDRSNDVNSVPIFMREHSLISISQYETAYAACKGDFWVHRFDAECMTAHLSLFDNVKDIDKYNIYADCYGGAKDYTELPGRYSNEPPLTRLATSVMDENGLIPCVDTDNMASYFNRADVKAALAARTVQFPWALCSMKINRYYDWTYDSMIPIHRFLLSHGYRGMIYSGDIDMAVNALGSQASVDELIPGVKNDWYRWYAVDEASGKQVGGWWKQSSVLPLRYVTVRGAGHMVPQDQPVRAFTMLRAFLNDLPLS